jgi:tetratricopeptide (TPR) repeat protein
MSMDRIRVPVESELVELRFLENIAGRLPEDPEVLKALAELYTRTGDYEKGLAADQRLSRMYPKDSMVWYNLGCSYALTRNPDQALEALTRAVDLGYCDYDWMKTDPDLSNLTSDLRFQSLLNWLYDVCSEENG